MELQEALQQSKPAVNRDEFLVVLLSTTMAMNTVIVRGKTLDEDELDEFCATVVKHNLEIYRTLPAAQRPELAAAATSVVE